MEVKILRLSFLILLSAFKVASDKKLISCVDSPLDQKLNTFLDCNALEDSIKNHTDFFNDIRNRNVTPDGSCERLTHRNSYQFYFKNCQLTTIPNKFFDQLSDNIGEIYLDYAGVRSITAENFRAKPILKILSISHNNITELPPILFENSTEIKNVDFSHNQITTLDPKALSGATGLEKINLAHNFIVTVPEGLFDSLTELSDIDFSHNSIELFHPELRRSSHLNKLNLSHNKITRLSCNIFPNSEIPDLKAYLDVTNNQLKGIDLNCDKKGNGIILNVEDNQLEYLTLPSSTLIAHLHSILAARNKIKKISVESESTELKSLMLANNSFTKSSDLLDVFKYCTSLTTLDLSFNIVQLGANSLLKLSKLKNLYLNNMNMARIEYGALSHSKSLELLDLSHNNLNQFYFNSFVPNTKKLAELRLSDNHITEFIGSPKVLPHLSILDILNNNLNCSYLNQFLEDFGSAEVQLRSDSTLQPDDTRANLGGVTCIDHKVKP